MNGRPVTAEEIALEQMESRHANPESRAVLDALIDRLTRLGEVLEPQLAKLPPGEEPPPPLEVAASSLPPPVAGGRQAAPANARMRACEVIACTLVWCVPGSVTTVTMRPPRW